MKASRIHILPPELCNQIAAGEVVERPASVGKELVENSLDAGARHIEVEAEGAGRRLLRVSDDGCGMNKEELELAVQRHATSKISTSKDLQAISTYGFRGEALPSIAAVSRFWLQSRAQGATQAWGLWVEGGKANPPEPAALAAGTKVEVRELFFNTPARLKFMRQESTEAGRLQMELLRLALPHPEVAFRLRLDGRLALDLPRCASRRERAAQALGTSFLTESATLSLETQGLKVEGFAGSPRASRSNRSGQFLFINGRPVEHRLLGFTLQQAYGSLIPAGRHPSAVIFLEMPPDEVDVNVHPAKREVRFRDERAVLAAIERAVAQALASTSLMVSVPATALQTAPLTALPTSAWQPALSVAAPPPAGAPAHFSPGWQAPPLEPAIRPDWPVPLAQLHKSYLLCEDSEGLVIVDQHAAHERVLYEGFLRQLGQGQVASQRLLLPQRLHPGARGAQRLRAWIPVLQPMGLEITDMGGGTFFVEAIPEFLKNVQVGPLLQDLLTELDEELEADPLGAFRREVAARMACRAAVKAGDALTFEDMSRILSELSRCETPWACPHGRPPLMRISLAELEKRFERR